MKEVTLPIDLANAILQYLSSRPYGEVVQLIAGIQSEAAKQAEFLAAPAADATE